MTLSKPVPDRLIIGVSGASGSLLAARLLELLAALDLETHLVVSSSAAETLRIETTIPLEDLLQRADYHYDNLDLSAPIASGSFQTRGMLIIPCSIKTLSAVANSFSADLIARAADVTLKEGRPLGLVVRETPLHRGHLRLMDKAARSGAIIYPPVPAFYTGSVTLTELIDQLLGRILARIGIPNSYYQPWEGNPS